MNINELNEEQTYKLLDSFLKRLYIKLAEKLTEEDIEKLSQVIEEINKKIQNFDPSSFKTLGDIIDYFDKNIASEFREFFDNRIPNFDDFILDVWIEHLKELAKD
jgi:DNA-binding GntR family transcriptional regulator